MTMSDDVLWYIDQALDAMVGIVTELGDELANRPLPVAGSNSPYAILTHCLGVMEYWGGAVIAGRPIRRDRAAEFVATGEVAPLAQQVVAARRQLVDDLAGFDPEAPPTGAVPAGDQDQPLGRTQMGVLLHVYEELSQHLGQMEVTRDVLVADNVGR